MLTRFARLEAWLAVVVVVVVVVVPSVPIQLIRHDHGSGERATCSPREPFAPPVIATLRSSGLLALDKRRGLVIVVSSADGPRSTVLSVATYDATTGKAVRSRQIVTAPMSRGASGQIVGDETAVALDEATRRVFVVHEPYGVRFYPRGRVDVLDEDSLALLRAVPTGNFPRSPAVDERTARVFVANQASGTMNILDARTGRLLRTVAVGRGPLGPSAAPVVDEAAGRVFFAAYGSRDNVVMLDAASGAVLRRVTVSALPEVIAVDRRIGRVIVAGAGSASVLDARTGAVLSTTALPGSPGKLLADESGHRAFISYSDNVNVSMLDTATGRIVRTTPVRLDHTLPGRLPAPDQAENETYPILERVDERRRWVVVRVPPVVDDDGPEQGPSQIAVLDSRTATRIHTVFSEPTWPDAVAVDDRRGRAFSNVGDAIDVYDISCLTSYYIFGDMG